MCCNFLLQLNILMAKRRTFLSAFGPETDETNELSKKKSFLTCTFQNLIRALALSGRENFGNSYYFNILNIV